MPDRHSSSLSRPWGVVALSLALAVIFISTANAAKYPISAPDFTLPDINGDQIALKDITADNVLLLFGTTWCPHCDEALPIVRNFARFIERDKLEIIFISVREKTADVTRFAEKKSLPCRVLLDKTATVARQYQASRIPTCVFIDSDRQIQFAGRPNEDIIWRLLSGERPITDEPAARQIGRPAKPIKPHPTDTRGRKRFIVELNEHPALPARLSEAARRARRKQYTTAAETIGARVIHNYGSLKNKIVVDIDEKHVDKLRQLPKFKAMKEDRPVHALLEDSAYQIRADYAWDNAVTGQGVKVCVVDTGVDYTHPDLINRVVAQYDAQTGIEDCMDDNGHGTHVAGIIASQGLVYRGVSYDVSIMGAKVLDYSGSGFGSDVMMGINWCVENGADVINLSLGEGLYSGTCDFEEMAQAVNAAVDAGVVVTCASGNDGDPQHIVAPACASKAIAVGSVDKSDVIASYSDGGAELDLVAPGGGEYGGTNFPEIASTYSTLVAQDPFYCLYQVGDECYDIYFLADGDKYIRAVGTSMAAPHVAAAAALLLEENPDLTPAQVKAVLQDNADDLGAPGWDNIYGAGRINIERALENIPAQPSELVVRITEPNTSQTFGINEQFTLAAEIDCLGGDGCGHVEVYAQFCPGGNCSEFFDINDLTPIATLDNNPNDLGVLSGCTVETDAPMTFDAATTFDFSESAYAKNLNPTQSLVGSPVPGEYSTGDLEPGDGLTFAQGDEVLYEFQLPAGTVRKISVRLENYFIVHFDEANLSAWTIHTANAAGDSLQLIDQCIPAEGGGGYPPPPDCWFVSESPSILGDLNPGGTSYIKLGAINVGDYDWMTFNDLEVIVEYEPDPENDSIHRYTFEFDLTSLDTAGELSSAYVKLNIAAPAPGAVAELHLIDPAIAPADSAATIHEANAPTDTRLVNPIKTFSAETAGLINLNVKAALQEALDTGKTALTLQVRERNHDQQFTIDASASAAAPTLTISQTLQQGCPGQDDGQPQVDPNSGPKPATYDTLVMKDVSEEAYYKFDDPGTAVIGAEFAAEYSTGDLEPGDGLTFAQGDEVLYEFQLPEGFINKVSVRLENYFIVHFDEANLSAWTIHTANAAGDSLHLIDECIPAEGGGGYPPPPDCWFVSESPSIINDLNPGGKNYIKLGAINVGDYDWMTFNDLEVIVEYQIDPNNDSVSRYYVKFDISTLDPEFEIDSAQLNLNVATAAPGAVAEIHLADAYDPETGPFTIYNAQSPDYSSLSNPIKTFTADSQGLKKVNVKPALEDAVESSLAEIAFLITEHEEDTIFSLDAATGQNPPTLDVYLKSSISGGAVKWTLTPKQNGPYTLRILAQNDVGITGISDEKVVNIFDPNIPTINSVQCLIDSTWQDCANLQYNDTLFGVRIDAHDAQQTPEVHLEITNIPDNHSFFDAAVTFDGQYFTRLLNLPITDSGAWQINVTCEDADSNTDSETINWFIPWGTLSTNIISPATSTTVRKGDSFTVTAEIQCLEAECPDTTVELQINTPIENHYDDGSAEDYGDLGSTDTFIAVRLTPSIYPAQIKTARFYVWDKTTHPFELNVWDDNGPGGAPGTKLITPFEVDPVSGSIDEVAWFEVDLTDRNIIINSGDFYIGWRQLYDGKLNQVGFDTTGPLERRTYGYLGDFGGWFNLDDLCGLLPEVCGNIMIRAIVSEPGTYSGPMPATAAPAPFYTVEDHPRTFPSIGAGQTHNATFTVQAVGAPTQSARIDVLASNTHSFDADGPIRATIDQPQSPCHAANLDAIDPVDFKDLAVLLSNFLDNTGYLPADINNDNETNTEDLARIAEFWLEACN